MKKKLSLALSLLLVVSTLVGCGSGAPASSPSGSSAPAVSGGNAPSGDPIKIAFSGPMTGDYAEYGQNFNAAAQVAVEEINANGGLLGGRQVELVQYDDKNSQEEVGAIAEMIAGDKTISAVAGHFSSGVAMTAANTYKDAGLSLLSASASHPDYSSMSDYNFRNNVLITQEVQNVLEICQFSGSKRVGILVLKNDWGQGAKGALDKAYSQISGKANFEIVISEEIMDGTEDFSANITKFIDADCDTIFVLTMYATFAPFANQYRALNPDIKMFSVGSAYSQELINLGGSGVEGVRLVAGFNPESDNEVAKSFVKRFKDKTGRNPDNMSAQTYENVMMIAQAIERAGSTDREAVKEALYKTDYAGITGHLQFDANGDAKKTQLVFEIQNGNFKELTDMKLLLWDDFVNSL